jgi:hypothetical protein
MKPLPWLALAAALLVPPTLLPAQDEAPLPAWPETARKAAEKSGWLAGAHILTDEAEAGSPAPAAPKAPDLEAPTAEDLAEDQAPSAPVPEKFLEAYFGSRPETYLIDPQGLLDQASANDRLAFLNEHAGDSSIDLFVYVFAKDQEIPGEVRAEELIERFFASGRPALLVYYHLGAPQQTLLYLSPSLTDGVAPAEQRRALQSAVMQALEKPSPQQQLEAFTVQMAIRVYWMERLLGGDAVPEDPAQQRAAARSAKLAKTAPSLAERWAGLRPVAEDFAAPGLALASVCAAALALLAWLRERATYPFPDLEVEPRLGGDHAAGVGAVISFASAALPPASQRDQIPDYLRRA